MKLVFSFDDYSPLNYRLADLIEKYGFVKNTIFYIAPINVIQIRELHNRGFEIGNHTHNHTILKGLSAKAVIKEIEMANDIIKDITDYYPKKFCYPRGRWDEVSKKIIGKYFREARTTKIFNYKEPENPLETDTTIHFSYPRKEYKGRNWLGLAKEYYKKAKKKRNGRFELWGHAEECDRFNQWKNLERFLKWIK